MHRNVEITRRRAKLCRLLNRLCQTCVPLRKWVVGQFGGSTATLGCADVLFATPASTGRSACATTAPSASKLAYYPEMHLLDAHGRLVQNDWRR